MESGAHRLVSHLLSEGHDSLRVNRSLNEFRQLFHCPLQITEDEIRQTKAYCQRFLQEQCQLAYEALKSIPHSDNPRTIRAHQDLEIMVRFIEEAAH